MNRTWLAVSESQKSTLKNELQTEVTIQHPLFGWQLDPIGRSFATDDVLFIGEENKQGVVHLTWSGPGDHQFPSTEFFATWSEFAAKKMATGNLGY
ncbi:hypothetical protein [Spirosoma validum]|uniref:Uncharacterized protein n=1 Tax=Spirosoma validum TaxID=2771355 RepID=A0A927GGL6_9BACT|nr:hypothetical protein [Spirosoma validum]MBD2756833.1 hypothetical protein [Spirosoma validum]